MSAGSLIVVLNSLRLRGFTLAATVTETLLRTSRLRDTAVRLGPHARHHAAARGHHRDGGTYLTIGNASGTADELVAVRSPRHPHPGPVADDAVLQDPARFETNRYVPLALVFRHAGQIAIDPPVSVPGAP